MLYLKVKHVQTLAKKHNRRVSKTFLRGLSMEIERLVIRAAQEKNGGKRTLDNELLSFILRRGKI